MPGRKTPLVTGNYYHVFNRGSDHRDLFLSGKDFQRFQLTAHYYQYAGPKIKFSKYIESKLNPFQPLIDKKLVEIFCFCFMPNHVHFLVRQLKENGISIFMSQLTNSYTKYFNTKNDRIGPLFQGAFKAVLVESDEQLLHLSRYIHLNPVVSNLAQDPFDYNWSPFREYMNKVPGNCDIQEILNFFQSKIDYQKFTEDQIEYGRTLELIKHQILE